MQKTSAASWAAVTKHGDTSRINSQLNTHAKSLCKARLHRCRRRYRSSTDTKHNTASHTANTRCIDEDSVATCPSALSGISVEWRKEQRWAKLHKSILGLLEDGDSEADTFMLYKKNTKCHKITAWTFKHHTVLPAPVVSFAGLIISLNSYNLF